MNTKCCPLTAKVIFFDKELTLRQKMALWLICLLAVSTVVIAAKVTFQSWMSRGLQETSFSLLTWASGGETQQPTDSLSMLPETLRLVDESESLKLVNTAKSSEHAGELVEAGDVSLDGLLCVPVARLDSMQPTSMIQRYSGIVMARRTSQLSAKHLARVVQISVDLGDKVQAGQVLAELDCRELLADRDVLAAQLDSARARLQELQRGPRIQEIEQAESLVRELDSLLTLRKLNIERVQGLARSSSVSKQELDENSNAFEAAQAQLLTARKSLELLREGTRHEQIDAQKAVVRGLESQIEKITILIQEHSIAAPFHGHVRTRFVHEGVVVSPGQAILEIVESDHPEIRVGLPPQLANSATLRSVRVICGRSKLDARLLRVAPVVDQRTRNLEVVFQLPHPLPITERADESTGTSSPDSCERVLRIGEAVDVQLTVPTDNSGWWVPSSALVPAARGLWALAVAKPNENDAYVVCNRQVELLRSSGEWTQVKGPLDNDEWVIMEGLHRLTAGQQVRCIFADKEIIPVQSLDKEELAIP